MNRLRKIPPKLRRENGKPSSSTGAAHTSQVSDSSQWTTVHFTVPEGTGSSRRVSLIKGNWTVTGTLRVSCDKNLTNWSMMERTLEHILDVYDGNMVFKPLILLFYWILGVNLAPIPGPSNRHCWGVDFGEPISLNHRIELIGSQDFGYSKNFASNFRGHKFTVEFNINFVHTQRRTTSVVTIVNSQVPHFKDRRRFRELLEGSQISYEYTEEEGLVLT